MFCGSYNPPPGTSSPASPSSCSIFSLPASGQIHDPAFLVFLDIRFSQPRDQRVDAHIQIGRIFGRAGDDERRTRLVDQDAVDFVDDGEIERALAQIGMREFHICPRR